MKKKTLGRELIDAVQEALANPDACKTVRPVMDVGSLRKRLKLSQREFAARYKINLQTLRQWEQGTRSPDTTSFAYLSCIAKRPDVIRDILQ